MRSQILLKSNLPLRSIYFTEVPSSRMIVPDLESIVDEVWEQRVAEGARRGRELWNAQIYQYEGYKMNEGKLELLVSIVE
ncbi:MAG: hypothetical protein ACOCXT_02795 [Candidatus Dojkabacteria bacterium]